MTICTVGRTSLRLSVAIRGLRPAAPGSRPGAPRGVKRITTRGHGLGRAASSTPPLPEAFGNFRAGDCAHPARVERVSAAGRLRQAAQFPLEAGSFKETLRIYREALEAPQTRIRPLSRTGRATDEQSARVHRPAARKGRWWWSTPRSTRCSRWPKWPTGWSRRAAVPALFTNPKGYSTPS